MEDEVKYSSSNNYGKRGSKRRSSLIGVDNYYPSVKANRPNRSDFTRHMPRRHGPRSARRHSRSVNRAYRIRKRGSRHGKRARRSTRKFRGRRGRFGRKKGGSKKQFRKAVIDAIAPLDSLVFQRGDVFQSSTSSVAQGWEVGYHAAGNAANTNDPVGILDPGIIASISNTITTRLGLSPPYSIAWQMQKASIVHTLTNASNRTVTITGYKCAARHDLPNQTPYQSVVDSIRIILGRGFSDSGIDTANRGNTNAGLLRGDLTPYDSSFFVQTFRIKKKRTVRLLPGRSTKFSVRLSKPVTIRPNRLLSMPLNTTTYATASVVINWTKGETFWIWRIQTDVVTNNNADTANIAGAISRVNCRTFYNYDYKYLNNLLPTITAGSVTNIVAPVSVNVMPPFMAGTVAVGSNNA